MLARAKIIYGCVPDCARESEPVRLVNTRARLTSRAEDRQVPSSPSGCAATALRHGIARDSDHVGSVLRRSVQARPASCRSRSSFTVWRSGMPACCSAPTWSELYIRIGEPGGKRSQNDPRAPSRTATRVVEFTIASFSTSGTWYIIAIAFSTITSSSVTGCISLAASGCACVQPRCNHATARNANIASAGQHLHPIARVVVRVRPKLRNKDRDRSKRDRVDVERQRHPQQQRTPVAIRRRMASTSPANRQRHHAETRLPRRSIDLRGACKAPAPTRDCAIRDSGSRPAAWFSSRSPPRSKARA